MKNLVRAMWPARWRSGGYMQELVRRNTQGVVCSGPFRGLRYVEQSFCSALMPKLLGVYERELHGVIEEVIAWQPSLVVDIGAAEGYYAVGMAQRLPSSEVIAFEADDDARAQLMKLVLLNKCKNVRSLGTATPESLAAVAGSDHSRIAVICDCEGAEIDLLGPVAAPWLDKAFIVCELHDFLRPGAEATLLKRFRATHDVRLIPTQDRHRSEFPFHTLMSRLFPDRWVQTVLAESRLQKMNWLIAVPRTHRECH